MTDRHITIPAIVQQHAEESCFLRATRSYLVRASHIQLRDLAQEDERLAAHLDGLKIAEDEANKAVMAAAQDDPDVGECFTATVLAIENRDPPNLDSVLELAETSTEGRQGVISAFGWVSADGSLNDIVRALLKSPRAFRREVGLAACAMHRIAADEATFQALRDADATLRARAWHVIGGSGRAELIRFCSGGMADDDARCVHEAARAAALLGERHASMEVLTQIALAPGPWRCQALMLLLKLLSPQAGQRLLEPLTSDAESIRLLIRGRGILGDAQYIPWLIEQMSDVKLARLAGEAFSFITGQDLSEEEFELETPEDVETALSENPDGEDVWADEDEDVSMDEDEDLPWPDPAKIDAWWHDNAARFTPGARYFLGEPPSPAHCLHVLRDGYQRQRIAAADWRCLLQPGTPLFNTAAPARRQRRWLDAMGAGV
jgi:uncharacterized protein (TIGR02270 family)